MVLHDVDLVLHGVTQIDIVFQGVTQYYMV